MPEIPLVVDDSSESITKTSKAVQILKAVGAYEDAEKAKDSKNVRRGKGKMRNRRYVNRKGPLVIYGNDNGIAKAFRNLPGVDTAPVSALYLMQVKIVAALPYGNLSAAVRSLCPLRAELLLFLVPQTMPVAL